VQTPVVLVTVVSRSTVVSEVTVVTYVLVTVEVEVLVVVVMGPTSVPVIVIEVGVFCPPTVEPVQTTPVASPLGTNTRTCPVDRLDDPPMTGMFTSVNVNGAPQLPLPSPRLFESSALATVLPAPESITSALEAEYRFA
jgi:hypothetical protein